MREFPFYLEAWCFCRTINLDPTERIFRKDWKTWVVNTGKKLNG